MCARHDAVASRGARERIREGDENQPTFRMHFTPWCSFFLRFSSVRSWLELSRRGFHFGHRLPCSPMVGCARRARRATRSAKDEAAVKQTSRRLESVFLRFSFEFSLLSVSATQLYQTDAHHACRHAA